MRALSVLALALLGATPFVSCSHLAVTRKGGASVAMVVVLDDSLSMAAQLPAGGTLLARARSRALKIAALQLLTRRDGGKLAASVNVFANDTRVAAVELEFNVKAG